MNTTEAKTGGGIGRITVFSLKTCPHCKKAKALFDDLGWAYEVVSLTDYPEKRSDMLKLADRLTVPQIFFNSVHIGGASELKTLKEEGKLKAMYEKMKHEGAPTNPLLNKPHYEPKEEAVLPERKEEMIEVGETSFSYVELSSMLSASLKIEDRSYRLSKYPKCFVGKELVDWLVNDRGIKSREEAVQIGQSMQGSGLFHHVARDHELKDDELYYRLQSDESSTVLNTYRTWNTNDRVGPPMAALKSMQNALSKVIEKHRDNDGVVDYEKVEREEDFTLFEERTCELQAITLEDMSVQLRTAYCINVYNMMISHAFAKIGAPTSTWQRGWFFENVSYNLGGNIYSFNSLENGILRANRVPPYKLRRPFGSSDPRQQCANSSPEARIHFALNCGAKSCPPVKWFTEEAIDEELRIVAMAFLEQEDNCRVDVAGKVLWLSKILSWYKSDFGSSNQQVVHTILPWTRSEKREALEKLIEHKFKIRHNKYDWGNDAAPRARFVKR